MITDKELIDLLENPDDRRIKDCDKLIRCALAELLGRRQFDKRLIDLATVFVKEIKQ